MYLRRPMLGAALVFTAVWTIALPLSAQVPGEKQVVRETKLGERFDAGRKWAILVGVNHYDDNDIPPLQFCVADARLLKKTLVERCGYSDEHVLLIADDQEKPHLRPSKLNLLQQIPLWLKNASPSDTVLVFFSGHGDLDDKGQGYLCPNNCEAANIGLTSVRTDELRNALALCKASQKLLILDCCHAGGEKSSAQAHGPSGEELGAAFQKAEGLVTLASCRKKERSREWPAKGQGLFTYFLSEGLGGAADITRDGIVDSDELYRYTFDRVTTTAQREFGASQTPARIIREDTIGVFALSRVSQGVRGNRPLPPDGFTSLFNGQDLTGWKGLVGVSGSPLERSKLTRNELAKEQFAADEIMRAHWKAEDGMLVFDGQGQNLCTAKDFGNFELYVDWKIQEHSDSGIYLRGTPQVQIADPKYKMGLGSGGLYNNVRNPKNALVVADNPIGEWNTFYIKMVGDKVTVKLNGKLVVDNVTMENYWSPTLPIFARGQIELQSYAGPLWFRNIYVRELPSVGDEIENTLGMKLAYLPPGEFNMGSPVHEAQREADETQHAVTLSQAIYLGTHEVTVGQFQAFVLAQNYKTEAESDGKGGFGFVEADDPFVRDSKYNWKNPGFLQYDSHPVTNVSWNDARAFCAWLSRKESKQYRLPTEAEWECACRAGTSSSYASGADPESLVRLGSVADGTAKAKFRTWSTIAASDGYVYTSPVGRFQPNAWGFYDMHGNVLEWCEDWYAATYDVKASTDPKGPASGESRVVRGGGWIYEPSHNRSANRYWNAPNARNINLGFRVALIPNTAP